MPLGHLGGAHILRGEFPRFSRDSNALNPTVDPPPPPPAPSGPRTHCRQIPGTQTPCMGGVQGGNWCPGPSLTLPGPSSGPPWPPVPPLAPPGPWPPLAPLALSAWPPYGPPWPLWPWPPRPALAALFGGGDKCLPVLAAKAEVGIEGASPKP